MQNMDHRSDQAAGETPGRRLRVRVMTRGLVLALLVFGVAIQQLGGRAAPYVEAYEICEGFGGIVQALTMSAEGRTVFACTFDGKLTVWESGAAPRQVPACANGGPSVRIGFAPNASMLGVSDRDQSVVLWDFVAGRPSPLPLAVRPIWALAFSANGATLALADGAGVRLVDVATRAAIPGMAFDVKHVASLAFSPDARTLAMGARDGKLWLWHLSEGRPRPPVRAHLTPVNSLAFTTDGKLLASASMTADDVGVWSAETGRRLALFRNQASVQALAFAPGGSDLATAGHDGAVRIWNVLTTSPPRIVIREPTPITALGFSPNGMTLACGGMGWIGLYKVDELIKVLSH